MIKKSFTRLLQITKPSGYQYPNTLSSIKKLNGYTPLYYFAKKTVEVPKMGDSVVEGTVLEIKKKVGEAVKVDEPVIILETDKVQVEVRATEAGVVTKIFPQMQEVIGVGKPAFEIDTEGTATASSAPQKEAPKQTATPQQQAPTQQAAPKKEEPKAAPKPESKPQTQQVQQVFHGERTEKREPMSKIRQIIAKRLKDAQNTTAMLTTFQEVDMSAVMDARKEFGDEFQKKHGIKLGFMSFFLRAAALALQDQPIVNSVIADNAKEIIARNYIDISVAVSTPTGLLVPVIKNVDQLSFAGIEKKLGELGERGRLGKITPDELVGGTFTVSNGGIFGSLMGTPIINTPQSAILGMHAVVNRPVVVKDQIVARPMMYLALTYDHRLLDGKEAVTFLKKIRTGVEDPRRMLLGL